MIGCVRIHLRERSLWLDVVVALSLLAAACGAGDHSSADLTSEQEQMLEVLEQHFGDRNKGDLDAIVAAHSDEATITLRETRWNTSWTGGVAEYVAWLAPYVGERSGTTRRLDATLVADDHLAFTFWEEKATGTSMH